jgi:hypothetical protein
MFDRIEVNVIDVPLEIPVLANGVFPESALPERVLLIPVACDRGARLATAVVNRRLISCQRVGKSASPSGNVIMTCR